MEKIGMPKKKYEKDLQKSLISGNSNITEIQFREFWLIEIFSILYGKYMEKI